jgi:hypothetical protein
MKNPVSFVFSIFHSRESGRAVYLSPLSLGSRADHLGRGGVTAISAHAITVAQAVTRQTADGTQASSVPHHRKFSTMKISEVGGASKHVIRL